MGKISAIISIAALAGLGFYVGKKIIEKRAAEEEERASHIYEDDSELFVEEHHSTPKEKLQKASLFAVGAIKTGTEKFKEGIDDIINKDMVSKGEKTLEETKNFACEKKDQAFEFAKNTAENVKGGIENIKNKVIQKTEDAADGAEELADAIAEAADEAADKEATVEEKIAAANPDPIVEKVEDEVTEAADELDSISVSDSSADEVETFDFSNPTEEQL